MSKNYKIFQNLNIKLETDLVLFKDYFNDYFNDNISFFEKLSKHIYIKFDSKSKLDVASLNKMVKYSSNFYNKNNEFVFEAGNKIWLKIRFESKKIKINVYDRRDIIRKNIIHLIRGKSFMYQTFMYIIRQTILLPSFYNYYIEHNFITLHASALKLNGFNLAFTGLNGCGKSGLVFNFLQKFSDTNIISDNYLLVDNNANFISVPEPIRLDYDLKNNYDFIEKKICRAFNKNQYKIDQNKVNNKGKVDFIFLTTIGPEFKLKKVNNKSFIDSIYSIHSFLGETPEQNYFELISNILDGKNLEKLWLEVLESFCIETKCFILTIPFEKEINGRYNYVEDQILKLLND